LNWRGLPLKLAAILASGLPEESRVRRRASGSRIGTDTLLLASIADTAAMLLWRHMKKGTPKPASLVDILTGKKKPEPQIRVFRDGAAFDRALARFIDGGEQHAG